MVKKKIRKSGISEVKYNLDRQWENTTKKNIINGNDKRDVENSVKFK